MSVDFQWAKSIREICKLIMNTCLVTIITNKRLFITQRQGIEKMFMLECIHWTIINGFSHTMNSVCRVSIFLCKRFWHWNFVAPKMHLMDVMLYMLIECILRFYNSIYDSIHFEELHCNGINSLIIHIHSTLILPKFFRKAIILKNATI